MKILFFLKRRPYQLPLQHYAFLFLTKKNCRKLTFYLIFHNRRLSLSHS
ncbi:hypothetical protein [Phage Phass-1]|uniref:Uncharacterized protein n=1 Tax=Phage Phass-1 TaxID=3043662 RepID=A0AAF0LZX6_9CAUD|nr:hypothetical protein [Phage Phass-1]